MGRYVAGVDIGSTTSKAVILDEAGEIVSMCLVDTIFDRNESGERALTGALEQASLSRGDLCLVGATGYGRNALQCAEVIKPEVISHAKGTFRLKPDVRTIVDIGGQDSKVIECRNGLVTKFQMNDKCAAGTGRFFEVLSERLLSTPIDSLGQMALASENPVRLSSMCTVFAETEIISLLSQGVNPNDIVRGTIVAMMKRIVAMARGASVQMEGPIVVSGGAALNCAVAPILTEITGQQAESLPNPQMTAALGIALDAYAAAGLSASA